MAERAAPRRSRLLVSALLAVSFSTGVGVLHVSPAAAESAREVRDLARQAKNDPSALERLRAVDDVDGTPADFRTALEGAEGDDLQRRLDLIESEAGRADTGIPARNTPQEEADRILDSERYRPDEPPRPLRGVIRRLGEWLSPVLEPIGRALGAVGRFLGRLLDNPFILATFLLSVALFVGFIASALIRRRTRLAGDAKGKGGFGAVKGYDSDDPKELERQADAAEAAGDFDLAFRLRFRAGLLRLDKAGVIELSQSDTTGQLVRAIRSATFPKLARTFDEVVYGGRTPPPEAVQEAKADWPRVLEEARR